MIRVSWLTCTSRPRTRRTLPYTRRRRSQARAKRSTAASTTSRAVGVGYNEAMIFDQHPMELPVATLQSRDSRVRFAMAIREWFVARWAWFRPRAVPVLVAFAGMLGVLASASYLRNLAHETPEMATIQRRAEPNLATLPTIRLDVPSVSRTR